MSTPHYKPQHVIALATINEHRAHQGLAPFTWEQLECEPRILERALIKATYILEALDAADLHVAEGGR